ncbi:MAG: MotA/TolQ/ExbB proton channel family protein [Candidatus Omnitrophota bacterium]
MFDYFVRGGPVMYPLLACSVVSLAIIIERIIFWLRLRTTVNRRSLDLIIRLAGRTRQNMAIRAARSSRDFIAKILLEGVKHFDHNFDLALETAVSDALNRMRRYTGILDTIVTLAPLLGIFGTVLGIIDSFNLLGSSIVDPKAVTGGIAQALITTAAGLAIAMPTLIFNNYFNARIESSASEIEKYVNALEMTRRRAYHTGERA